MRWQDGMLTRDICFSSLKPTSAGFEAEGFFHEDWHDPGDAQGFTFEIHKTGDRLTVHGTDWAEGIRDEFFSLDRDPTPNDGPAMPCPIE